MSQVDASADKPHILVVDDDTRLRELLRSFLSRNGFRVTVAANAAEARERLDLIDFDLIVLDVMMPGEMDGLQVLDAIKADPQLVATRVIMVTARGQARDYDDGMARGADAYFIKPFSPLQLVSAIKEILAK